MTEQISLAFDLIRRYAEREGWIPIGFRVWDVGPWHIVVNGTRDERDGVAPYHAHVANRDYIGIMVMSPLAGSVGGFQGTEDHFIRDMEAALVSPSVPS